MINPNLEISCNELAKTFLFSSVNDVSVELEKCNVVYRKNKTDRDIQYAVTHGLEQGLGTTESELSMISYQLSKVLKLK